MKSTLIFYMIVSMITPFNHVKTSLNIDSGNFCVMCMNDNSVLYSNNREITQSVASISKIMTAIIAIEQGNLTDKIKIDKTILEATGSSIYLKVGDEYTLEQLLYGLILRSGNHD